jgi:hypothetical protein
VAETDEMVDSTAGGVLVVDRHRGVAPEILAEAHGGNAEVGQAVEVTVIDLHVDEDRPVDPAAERSGAVEERFE